MQQLDSVAGALALLTLCALLFSAFAAGAWCAERMRAWLDRRAGR
jgi:hypothetical protein